MVLHIVSGDLNLSRQDELLFASRLICKYYISMILYFTTHTPILLYLPGASSDVLCWDGCPMLYIVWKNHCFAMVPILFASVVCVHGLDRGHLPLCACVW